MAKALEPILPGRVRMVPYPLALRAPPMGDEDPGLDLPGQIVVTLMVLSLGSSAARKNPLAGVAAFKRAFADSTDQRLIIKLQGAAAYPQEAARIEGFGLVLAEAMLRGKPVVATGWSGNLAFMDENSAVLIGYRLVKVDDESGIYASMPGASWAEPDIGHAAEWLRKLGNDYTLR